jgi:hypothetical protein
MDRRIVGYHQDDELHWVAELDCGHQQHIRHDPPWQNRPWVLRPESRQEHLGTVLSCPLCDPPSETAGLTYQEAKMCGLCDDGADEVDRRHFPA